MDIPSLHYFPYSIFFNAYTYICIQELIPIRSEGCGGLYCKLVRAFAFIIVSVFYEYGTMYSSFLFLTSFLSYFSLTQSFIKQSLDENKCE